MRVKGIFPLPMTTTQGDWAASNKRHHPSHESAGTAKKDEKISNPFLGGKVNTAIAAQSSNYAIDGGGVGHYGPYNCVVSGKPISPPPDRFFNFGPLGHKTPKFQQRKREGDIIVTDYRIGQIWAKYFLGHKDVTPPKKGPTRGHPDSSTPFFEIEEKGKWIRADNLDYLATSHYVASEYRDIDISVNPYQVGWNDEIFNKMLRAYTFGPSDDMSPLITRVTAEANKVILDALTAAAEMPQTIKSIYEACLTLLRLYKDAKNKEFRLHNKLKRLSGDTASQNSARQRAKLIQDINDAIADVWLNFRYNIMPNVYLIEDLIKVLESQGKTFFRFRGLEQSDKEFNIVLPKGWTGDLSYNAAGRVLIKRSVAANSYEYKHLLQTNLFVTAWELVPLSFVVDWFLNIGDALSALLSPNLQNYEEGATFSWKTDTSFTFTHDQTKASVVAQMKCYSRAVFNPSDYCRISFNPDLSPVRQLDALALSWKLLKSSIK